MSRVCSEMPKVEYLEGSRPILYRALEKKSTFGLLSEDFCTVSDLPSKMQADVGLESVPNYAPKAVNIILQFKELCRGKKDSQCKMGRNMYKIKDNKYEMSDEAATDSLSDHTCRVDQNDYVDHSVYLAGDPTGSIYVLADDLDDVLGNTFVLLHTALHVINGRIVLQIARDTKLIKCSDSDNDFVNSENLSEKYKWKMQL